MIKRQPYTWLLLTHNVMQVYFLILASHCEWTAGCMLHFTVKSVLFLVIGARFYFGHLNVTVLIEGVAFICLCVYVCVF